MNIETRNRSIIKCLFFENCIFLRMYIMCMYVCMYGEHQRQIALRQLIAHLPIFYERSERELFAHIEGMHRQRIVHLPISYERSGRELFAHIE